MANQPEVRNDKITVPQRLDINHVRALALQKAQAKVRKMTCDGDPLSSDAR